MTTQTNPTQSAEPVAWMYGTKNYDHQSLTTDKKVAETYEKIGYIVKPLFDHPSPFTAEPVERLAFVTAIQSTVTDLVQQYALINMYDLAHPFPTLSAAELGQVLEALKQGHDQALLLHARHSVDGKYHNQAFAAIEQINAAIALIEKVQP